jgi:hypothetical protein
VRRPGLETPKSASSSALGSLVRAQSSDRASGTEWDGHRVFLTEEDFICCGWGTTCVDECAADWGGGFVEMKGTFESKIQIGKGRMGGDGESRKRTTRAACPFGEDLASAVITLAFLVDFSDFTLYKKQRM